MTGSQWQPALPFAERDGQRSPAPRRDDAFHDWYRFVLAYPPQLVRDYVAAFNLRGDDLLLDPFCGTGTTLVEAKLLGLRGAGIEANPFAQFAGSVKLDWDVEPDALMATATEIAAITREQLIAEGLDDDAPLLAANGHVLRSLDPEQLALLITDSIHPLALHKALALLAIIRAHAPERTRNHLLLAYANALVFRISNLKFGPEVGIGRPRGPVAVVAAWLNEVERMVGDLRLVAGQPHPAAQVHLGDSRSASRYLAPASVAAVITSPPYPNEKDYTRTTRLESVVLGFIQSKAELRRLKATLVRSNTRGVYKPDDDDQWIRHHPGIQALADAIEARRIELGKTSGFERMYARVTRLYFGGMARHLADLRTVLKPGAQLAYVVGDQASYLRVMIRTGQLLGEIAQTLGYELDRIDLFRTRFATATKDMLREEVVVLRWPG